MTMTTAEYDKIVHTIQLYIAGSNDSDIDKFRAAFHEDAWLFLIDSDGTFHKYLLSGEFESWANENAHVEARIMSVIQIVDAAGVVLTWDNTSDESDSWVDFHSLLRIDGVWKIMNKTATHSSR